MLTRKQYDLLHFIHSRLQKDGIPPSFDEMKEALDLRSKSGIHRLITALEERGFIRRLAHRARAIEILKLPETLDGDGGFQPAMRRPCPAASYLARAASARLRKAMASRASTVSAFGGRPTARFIRTPGRTGTSRSACASPCRFAVAAA